MTDKQQNSKEALDLLINRIIDSMQGTVTSTALAVAVIESKIQAIEMRMKSVEAIAKQNTERLGNLPQSDDIDSIKDSLSSAARVTEELRKAIDKLQVAVAVEVEKSKNFDRFTGAIIGIGISVIITLITLVINGVISP